MQRRLVVDGDLFTRADVSQRDEEYVFVENLHECVGLARMIDVVRSIPSSTSVQAPTIIDCADSKRLPMRSSIGFRVRNFFSGVFGDLSAGCKRFSGKASFAMDRGSFDG
jgi:hypothetical protein